MKKTIKKRVRVWTDKEKAVKRDYYEKNKKKYLEYSKTKGKDNKTKYKTWFKTEVMDGLFCSKCAENDVGCLDFHHIDPNTKEKSIARLVSNCAKKEKILAEIAKCQVLCSNCHRKLHFYENPDNLIFKKLDE